VISPKKPREIFTSSGTVGHSLSFGNRVSKAAGIPKALQFVQGIKGTPGAAIGKDDHIGVICRIQFADIEPLL
jgi:hypothetical protein